MHPPESFKFYSYRKSVRVTFISMLVMGALCACFSPEPGRDDYLDSYDRPLGAFPIKILGLEFDASGHLNLQVEYAHAYAMSKPTSVYDPPLVIRNYEIRIWEWNQGDWSQASLQNLSPNPPFVSPLRMDARGSISTLIGDDPWLKFYTRQDGIWRNRRQWRLDGSGYPMEQCETGLNSLGFDSDGRFYRACVAVSFAAATPEWPNGRVIYSMNLHQDDTLTTTLFKDVKTERIVDMLFRGDTLNALASGRDGYFWFRAIPKSESSVQRTWDTDVFALDSGHSAQYLMLRKEGVAAVGSLGDSVGWCTWRYRQRHFSERRISASQNLIDDANCLHSVSYSIGPAPNPEDTLIKDIRPPKASSSDDSLHVLYASSCRSGVDSLNYPPQPDGGYGVSPNAFLALSPEQEPWLALSVAMNQINGQLYYPGITVDSLVNLWRGSFRLELLKRESQGWEKVALPF